MNREIKFRGWDKKNKKWVGKRHLEYLCVADGVVVLVEYGPNKSGGYDPISIRQLTNPEVDNLEIVQFTGLTDRNGQGIWEGDVVAFEKSNHLVTWLFGAWVVYHGTIEKWFYLYEQTSKVEVIGNVFENHELLEADNAGLSHR